MITRLRIDNFKAFHNLDIKFNSFNVFVGNNNSGKSSLLLALSFLSYSTKKDFSDFLDKRHLKIDNLKSMFNPNNNLIKFNVDFEVLVDNKFKELNWGLYINVDIKSNTAELAEEWVRDKNNEYLRYNRNEKIFSRRRSDGLIEQTACFTYTSSILRFIKSDTDSKDFPELCAIKRFFDNSFSFELLDPFEMRQKSFGISNSIGENGSLLPSFVKGLDEKHRRSLASKLNKLDNYITEVSTITLGNDLVELVVKEQFNTSSINISSLDLSDGTLRLIALASITEMKCNNGFILLEEIENGINTQKVEDLINLLTNFASKNSMQMFWTTHSTVFVDYINTDQIYYMSRTPDNGQFIIRPLFSNNSFKDEFDQLYPGEILLNMAENEILERLLK